MGYKLPWPYWAITFVMVALVGAGYLLSTNEQHLLDNRFLRQSRAHQPKVEPPPPPPSWRDQLLLIQPAFPLVGNPNRSHEIAAVHQRNGRLFRHILHPNERHFGRLFDLAQEDRINVVANADIFFDHTIDLVLSMPHNVCYALSRWDFDREEADGSGGGARGRLFDRADSQDVWIFRGKLHTLLPGFANYSMGVPGCDNRLAWELAQSGYRVLNPSRTIKTWHYHSSGYRTYKVNEPVPGPYLLVQPTELEPGAAATGEAEGGS